MERLRILVIIACLALLCAPAAVFGDPAGPPGGLDVKIVNPLPVPVTGDVNATVSGDVNATVSGDVNAVQSGDWKVTVENDESKPVPVKGTMNVSTIYRYAGLSEGLTKGNAGGIVRMHLICQQTFSAMARMCTSAEFWQSPNITSLLGEEGGQAWIHPTVVTYNSNEDIYVDFSGRDLPPVVTQLHIGAPPTCDQWRGGAERRGTAVAFSEGTHGVGYIMPPGCDEELRVVCCLPVGQAQ